MRFSIITITFNAEKFLEDTLYSVSQQKFSSFEHILWDGGSKDRTLEIAGRFPHVKMYQGKDSGISDAMNRGAAFAQGEFLLFLHADDMLADPKILHKVDVCLKQRPHISWLYGKAIIIDEKGRKKRTTQFIPFSQSKLRKYNIITHPTVFMRRDLFIRSGGFAPLRYSMDYDLWLRLSEREKILPFAMPAEIAYFREHAGSLSTREKLEVAEEAYHVRNQYVKSLWERWKSYRTWKKRASKAARESI